MADKRKEGTGQTRRSEGKAGPVVKRRRTAGTAAGRIAVRRDTAPYRRAEVDEHSAEVRERIEAALAVGQRIRQEIEQRIDERLREAEQGEGSKVMTRLTAQARARPVKKLSAEGQEGTGRYRSR